MEVTCPDAPSLNSQRPPKADARAPMALYPKRYIHVLESLLAVPPEPKEILRFVK